MLKTSANANRNAPALRAILNGIAINARPNAMKVQKEVLTTTDNVYITNNM